MSGGIDNLGATDLLGNRNDALKARHEYARGWTRHAGILLGLGAVGSMLAWSTAYAAPRHIPVSNAVNDSIIDWGIAIFVVIIGMFIAMIIIDAKKNGRP